VSFAESRDVSPEAFAETIVPGGRGTMIEARGTRFVSAGGGRARAQLDFKPVTLIRNAGHGTLTAEADIVHRGSTILVVEVTVLDEQQRIIATLMATQLAPAAPPATLPAGRPGRQD